MNWLQETIWAVEAGNVRLVGQKMPTAPPKPVPAQTNTLVLYLSGIMVRNAEPSEAYLFNLCPMAPLAARLEQAKDEKNIEKVVLLIDSPGGSAAYTDQLCDAVFALRQTKTVIAYVRSQAASAAYFVASQCSKIYLESATSSLGSIGALYMHTARTDERITAITSSGAESKAALAGSELTADGIRTAKGRLDYLSGLFAEKIKRARKVDPRALNGDLFFGQQAVDLKLADGIRPLADVLKEPTNSEKMQALASPPPGLNWAEQETWAALATGQDPYRFCVTARDRELITQRLEKVNNHISGKSV